MYPTSELHISTQIQRIAALWNTAVTEAYPVALWRRPNTAEKQLAVDLSGKIQATKIDLEELPSGFVISPFQGEPLFLKADLFYCFDSGNNEIEDCLKVKPLEAEIFENKVRTWLQNTPGQIPDSDKHANFSREFHSEGTSMYNEITFAEMVEHGIGAIQEGLMQKVVLSRTTQVVLPESFDVVDAFNKLCKTYPNAFISAVYLPMQKVTWLCATPETLVSLDRNGIFRTMSLAGTQSAIGENGEKLSVSEAKWSHKDIEEQAFVSRYILECFKQIRLREYVENGPKTVLAGNLMHLRTDYSVDTQKVNFSQLGTVMLELLHPTSAVCGMPKENALRFIAENELHQREFYSGFLGPINIHQETHLFVNLRTMKIEGDKGTFFAGCGITEESNPMKEWHETEIKCQTLMDVIL